MFPLPGVWREEAITPHDDRVAVTEWRERAAAADDGGGGGVAVTKLRGRAAVAADDSDGVAVAELAMATLLSPLTRAVL